MPPALGAGCNSWLAAGRSFRDARTPAAARKFASVETLGARQRRKQPQLEQIVTSCCTCSKSAANTLALVAAVMATDDVPSLVPLAVELLFCLSFVPNLLVSLALLAGPSTEP